MRDELEEDENSLFRFENYKGSIYLYKYPIVRTTPKGCWIKESKWADKEKFILNGALRSFAHGTREEALRAFVARKRKQLEIVEHHRQSALKAMENVKKMKDAINIFNQTALQYKLKKVDELVQCIKS